MTSVVALVQLITINGALVRVSRTTPKIPHANIL